MKFKNISIGLCFVAIAAIILLNELGILTNISWMGIGISLLMLPLIVSSAIARNFTAVFVPLGVIVYITLRQFGILSPSFWIIMLVAVMLTIGFNFLFPSKRPHCKHDEHMDIEYINMPDTDENVNIYTKFAGSIKYIKANNLKTVNIDASFSGVKVYLDSANLSNDGVTVNIFASFAGVELYVPKNCRLKHNLVCTMGGIEEKGLMHADKTGTNIQITGNCKLSGVSIIYV